jgi:ABC-type histidine transport system ATPase subunit
MYGLSNARKLAKKSAILFFDVPTTALNSPEV